MISRHPIVSHYSDIKTSDPIIVAIKDEVERFTRWILKHHTLSPIRSSKVIHDGVWGTYRYEKAEIALIDLPLIQRLRQIHQTSNTFLTYPSAKHTRFEHTLGVTSQLGKLLHSLEQRFADGSEKKSLLGNELYRTLRFAAILHDCGHGPFSHTSEEIYRQYPEIQHLKRLDPFKKASAHEILAYLIIDSDRFKELLMEITTTYSVDFELIKNSIVGFSRNPNERYTIDMIHGPFDADKIDYLFRDSHFSGLPLQIDLERLWYALDINKVKGHNRLTIDWGGVNSIEQILFSKMTLFPSVYHHHKVRACDCMFKGIVEYIRNHLPAIKRKLNGDEEIELDFSRATHFLYFTDADFTDWNLSSADENIHKLSHDLIYRRLLKRAVVIARDTLKKECMSQINEYMKYLEEPVYIEDLEYYRWLANKIWKEAGSPGLLQELWVDCPRDANFDSASDTWVSPLGDNVGPMPITEFIPMDRYADQYKHKKWRSHVFCKPEHIDAVAKAAVTVFKTELNIEFNNLAFHLCNVTPPDNL